MPPTGALAPHVRPISLARSTSRLAKATKATLPGTITFAGFSPLSGTSSSNFSGRLLLPLVVPFFFVLEEDRAAARFFPPLADFDLFWGGASPSLPSPSLPLLGDNDRRFRLLPVDDMVPSFPDHLSIPPRSGASTVDQDIGPAPPLPSSSPSSTSVSDRRMVVAKSRSAF